MRHLRIVVLALVALRLVVAGVLVAGPWTDEAAGLDGWDIDRFHEIATDPGRPWVDREVEYPPGSVALIELVAGGGVVAGHRILTVAMLVVDLGLAALVWRAGGHRRALVYLGLGVAFLPTMYLRFDLLTAAAATGVLVALERRRSTVFGLLLGAGFAVKTWPAFLIGAASRREQRRAAMWGAAGIGVVAVGWALVAGLDGFRQVATFRGAEGWHVESLPGVVAGWFQDGPVALEEGAYRFGRVPDAFRVGATVATFVGWAALWERWRRGGGSCWLAACGVVAWVLVTSSLLSPQFLVWLLPLVAMAWAAAPTRLRLALVIAVAGSGLLHLVVAPPDAGGDLAQIAFGIRGCVLVWVVIEVWVALGRAAIAPIEPKAPAGRLSGDGGPATR